MRPEWGVIVNRSSAPTPPNWTEMNGYLLLGVLCAATCAWAQYGPVPPRPQQFAGATLVQPARQPFRQRPPGPRVVPEIIQPLEQPQVGQARRGQAVRKIKPQLPQPQVLDQQRTNLVDDVPVPFTNKVVAPTPVPQYPQQAPKLLTPRPVEEEVNEEEEIPTTVVTTPSTTAYTVPLRPSFQPAPAPAPAPLQVAGQIPVGFQRPQFLQPTGFRAPVPQQLQPSQFQAPALQGRQLVRQQGRPIQGVQVPLNRQSVPPAALPQIPLGQPQQAAEDEQYFRQVQSRPQKKPEPVRQQVVEREPVRAQPVKPAEIARQQPARAPLDYARPPPPQREPHAKAPQRERKPVAQTIRKYHEEHEDGSITWGYENDDGSFKEETIGVDCVTRGKYGYFDPDGVKREYTYQTGIPCDRTQEAEEAASNQGFIDYTNNKYVLPNGDEIDLEAMVKNRARKPVARY